MRATITVSILLGQKHNATPDLLLVLGGDGTALRAVTPVGLASVFDRGAESALTANAFAMLGSKATAGEKRAALERLIRFKFVNWARMGFGLTDAWVNAWSSMAVEPAQPHQESRYANEN